MTGGFESSKFGSCYGEQVNVLYIWAKLEMIMLYSEMGRRAESGHDDAPFLVVPNRGHRKRILAYVAADARGQRSATKW